MTRGPYNGFIPSVLLLFLVMTPAQLVDVIFKGPRNIAAGFDERDMIQTCKDIEPGVCCVPFLRNFATSVDFEPKEVEVVGLPENSEARAYQRAGSDTYCDGFVAGTAFGPDFWHAGPYVLALTGADWRVDGQSRSSRDFTYPDLIEMMDSPGIWGAPWTESGRGDGRYFNHRGRYMRFSIPTSPHKYGSKQRTRGGYCTVKADCSGSNCNPIHFRNRAILFGIESLTESVGSCVS